MAPSNYSAAVIGQPVDDTIAEVPEPSQHGFGLPRGRWGKCLYYCIVFDLFVVVFAAIWYAIGSSEQERDPEAVPTLGPGTGSVSAPGSDPEDPMHECASITL